MKQMFSCDLSWLPTSWTLSKLRLQIQDSACYRQGGPIITIVTRQERVLRLLIHSQRDRFCAVSTPNTHVFRRTIQNAGHVLAAQHFFVFSDRKNTVHNRPVLQSLARSKARKEKPVQLAASQRRVHISNMSRCTHRRVMSGLLGSRIREFVPRMPTVPSTPLQSDRRESLQNALGSSRVVDCLFVDSRSPWPLTLEMAY